MDAWSCDNGTLYYAKCFDVMPTLEKVDMVLCDPPYGTTDNPWDVMLPPDVMWAHIDMVKDKKTPAIVFAIQPFTSILISSNTENFCYSWVWVKNSSTGFLNSKKAPMRAHEDIIVFASSMPDYHPIMREGFKPYVHRCNGTGNTYDHHKPNVSVSGGERYPISCLEFGVINNTIRKHSAQKPVDLLSYLIRSYTKEGDTVLDFTMGSGSTCVACIKTGRKFIGIEKEKPFFDIAVERVKQAQYEMSLSALMCGG